MTNITFIQETNTPQQFDVAIILPSSQLNINNIAIHYRPYMNSINCIYLGIPDDLLVTVGSAKSTLEDIGKLVYFLKIPILYITNSHLFKSITKEKKVDTTYSSVFEAKAKEIGDRKVIYGVHPGNIFVSPLFTENLCTSLQTLAAVHHGTYTKLLGKAQLNIEIIDPNAIHEALQKLYDLPAITCDIEAYSLSHYKAGIATIAFGIDERTAIVTPVDAMPETAKQVREELSKFFSTYKGKVIFHNACYDAKVLKYEFGEWSFENTHCTKIISYLATNNAIDNKLALKSLAQEYLGNWGRDDLDDVSQIPINELLEYNAKDAVAAWFVYNKFYPKMVNDNQEQLYLKLFQPSIETIVDIELAGFPMIPEQIQKVKEQLTKVLKENTDILNNSVLIQHFNEYLRLKAQTARNSKLKTKQIPIEEFAHITFNPNSDQQICTLLFDMFKLPVLSKTKTGNPSTKASHLKILLQQDISEDHKQVISALIEISAVTILLDTFITAFEHGRIVGERSYLHGSFNLTGTVSSRLSSCVAPWTKIKTKRGLVPIAEVKVGDMVWTHKRRWQLVEDVILKKSSPMVDVHFCNGYILSCTTEHKLKIPNKGWMTLQEILNVNVSVVDAEPYEHSTHTRFVSPRRAAINRCCYSDCIKQYPSKHFRGTETKPTSGRVHCKKSVKILRIKNRRIKPNVREDRSRTSSLYRRMCRRLRILDNITQQQKTICTQSCNSGGTRNIKNTGEFICTSYRRKSIKQPIRQSGSLYKCRSPNNSFFTGNKCFGKIKAIYPRAITQVWDLTVKEDHSYWAEGCFNHNSNPNMQNFPSKGTKYAKAIKKCFAAPEGWVFCGTDLDSLEDKISALTTKDPNKCKVYLEGYDGHCLRAYAYFKDQMPDIDPTTAAGINKITDLYPHLRQASKTITFALTYQGTAHTLIKNCKLAPEDAYRIEKEYHALYAVSDEWVAAQLRTAASSGFVDVAFGLRLRTPLLARTVAGARHTPYQAQAEYRTAANALGQSYGMLNTRAATEFWQRVKKAGLQDSIKIISLIHDAIYLLVKANKDILTWAKTNLLECMAWQELPELKHDQIKLTSTFNLFMPTWADEIKSNLSWEEQLALAEIPLSQ